MKRIFAVLLAVMILAACAGAETADSDGGNAGNLSDGIRGAIEDGAYVLTVEVSGEGEWVADEMAQDDTVVKLAASGTEEDVFTARYEPAGDGAVTVSLQHYSVHGVCDEMHTFDLLVEGGKVKEVTGGSYTAAPDDSELEPYFSGSWLEQDTQFTALEAVRNLKGGWDIEIMSPVSHGAWVIRATAYYDCDYGALVYADGVKYDLIPGDELLEKETAKDLWGTLTFGGTAENVQITWYDMMNSDGETVVFERAPGLPAYAYSGEDPIEGAVANLLAVDERAEAYLTEPGYVTIPCPIIHKVEIADENHAKVYGSFWILNYVRRGDVLENISGGEYPGIIEMEKDGDEWILTSFTEAGDGDDYAADIEGFAGGDRELEEKYFAAADLLSAENQEIRMRFIRDYVESNGLDIRAYKDYGWDPVLLK